MNGALCNAVLFTTDNFIVLIYNYSYSSNDKICSFPHEDGTTDLDDVDKMDAQSGYDTVYFTGMQVLDLVMSISEFHRV